MPILQALAYGNVFSIDGAPAIRGYLGIKCKAWPGQLYRTLPLVDEYGSPAWGQQL